MGIKLDGFDELNKNLKQLQQNAEKLSEGQTETTQKATNLLVITRQWKRL